VPEKKKEEKSITNNS